MPPSSGSIATLRVKNILVEESVERFNHPNGKREGARFYEVRYICLSVGPDGVEHVYESRPRLIGQN